MQQSNCIDMVVKISLQLICVLKVYDISEKIHGHLLAIGARLYNISSQLPYLTIDSFFLDVSAVQDDHSKLRQVTCGLPLYHFPSVTIIF